MIVLASGILLATSILLLFAVLLLSVRLLLVLAVPALRLAIRRLTNILLVSTVLLLSKRRLTDIVLRPISTIWVWCWRMVSVPTYHTRCLPSRE